EPGNGIKKQRLVPWQLVVALSLIFTVSVTVMGQIRYGWIRLQHMKVNDPSLDMVGWDQLGRRFAPVAAWEEEHAMIGKNSPIITFRWFPAANFDYYVGRRINKPVYAVGSLDRIHKYHWINKIRGNLKQGSDAWYIGLSDDYEDPAALYGELFSRVVPSDTLYITRGRDTVRRAFLFHMIGLKQEMVFK
ncbi:MAG: hypothetical protein WCK34_02830, partial [Bacteroidota bacterium]